ncbi:MAG: hypothetical protein R3186_09695, partial [Ruegeria sp.]|nr:hypothetical protein [Ruegeria sp.]
LHLTTHWIASSQGARKALRQVFDGLTEDRMDEGCARRARAVSCKGARDIIFPKRLLRCLCEG